MFGPTNIDLWLLVRVLHLLRLVSRSPFPHNYSNPSSPWSTIKIATKAAIISAAASFKSGFNSASNRDEQIPLLNLEISHCPRHPSIQHFGLHSGAHLI